MIITQDASSTKNDPWGISSYYIGTGEIVAYLLPVLPVAISGADLSCLFAVFFLEVCLAMLACPVKMACYRYAAAWTVACTVILAPAIIGTGIAAWFSAVESLRGEIDGEYILDVFALSGGASGIIADRVANFRNRSLKSVLFEQHINRKYMFAHQPDKLIIPAWKSFVGCVLEGYGKLFLYTLIFAAVIVTGVFAQIGGIKQHVDFVVALTLSIGKICISLAVSKLVSASYYGCPTPEKQEKLILRHFSEGKITVLRQPADPSDNALSDKKPKGRITRGGWVAVK
ncbi:MAG: hypothetical protein ACTFAK_10035 [Candidatus Electronema sp. VV]